MNNTFDIPDDFYKKIKPYINEGRVITDTSELIALWQEAAKSRDKHPQVQSLIAEWTMSAAAMSPLVNDRGLFEEIHHTFGELEAENGTNAQWAKLKRLIAEANETLRK